MRRVAGVLKKDTALDANPVTMLCAASTDAPRFAMSPVISVLTSVLESPTPRMTNSAVMTIVRAAVTSRVGRLERIRSQ